MIDSERFKLLYGPYQPPKCRVGDKLPCEYRGREVTVRAMTDAPIQWPATRGGLRASPIVCGDLIRAVRAESEIAVVHHWGVNRYVVWKWRRALEVPEVNKGTQRLKVDYAYEILVTPEVSALALEGLRSPEARAKVRARMTGRPAHPNTAAGLRDAARRPKTETCKHKLSQRMRDVWEHPEEHGLPPCHHWTEEEIALLGTNTDEAIAQVLGLPRYTVIWKRYQLGIPSFRPAPPRWTEAEIRLLGTASDSEVARRLGRSPRSVLQKREHLRIPPVTSRWTEEEIGLLGSDTDRAVARALGRSRAAVASQRRYLGIAAYRRGPDDPPGEAAWPEERSNETTAQGSRSRD